MKDPVELVAKIVYGEEINVYAKQDFLRLLESVLCVTQEVHIMEKIVFVILDILEIEINVNHAIQVAVNAVGLKQTNASHVLTLLLFYRKDFAQNQLPVLLDIFLMELSAFDALITA